MKAFIRGVGDSEAAIEELYAVAEIGMILEEVDDREFIREQLVFCYSHIWDTKATVTFEEEENE